MIIQRMDNVAIVVDDLDAAAAFFTELGMELDHSQVSRQAQAFDPLRGN